jgi:Tfp pilus assembly protein PilO
MSKLAIKKSHIIIAVVFVCFILALIFWVMQSYHSLNTTLSLLSEQKNHFEKLSKDIEQTRHSIDKMRKEQDEFKTMLFDERDVPTFLDGISSSAAKSSVHVLEIKTQQFSRVVIPKDLVETSSKLAQLKSAEDPDGTNSTITKAQELTQLLTLAAMPIRIKVHGTFNSIVSFLNSIEGYRQLLTISNVEIAAQRDYPQLTCEFTLSIYSLKNFKDIKI